MMSFPSLRCLVALGSTLALGFVATAEAAAPMVKTPAPGFYRMMLGDFEVTALLDGTIDLPVDKYLTHTTPAKVKLGLAKAFETVPLETSVNAFLVNTGTKLILIDTGAGSLFGPTLGGLVTSLKAAGYAPDQIDEIYVTHMHGDHVGGLMANGLIVFRNATVRADQRESTHWLSDDKLKSAKDDEKEGFQAAMTSVGPYLKAGRFKPFDGALELVPSMLSRARAKNWWPGVT
jgi:glyoxylase-like metal-dependent hydrolase (beta-lactamase superfamily II)